MLTYHLKDLDLHGTGISLGFQKWRNPEAFPAHRHDCFELNFAFRGSGVNTIDGTSYPVIGGDVYIIRPGSVHSFYSVSELDVYNLCFSMSVFSRRERELFESCGGFPELFARTGSRSRIRPTPVQAETLRTLFTRLFQELSGGGAGFRIQAKNLLSEILVDLCRVQAENRNPEKKEMENSAADSLARILNFVHKSYLEDFSVHEVAAVGRISETYVSEFFRKHTGNSLKKYINALRIEKAKELLAEHSEWNVGETAMRAGFHDAAYFSRVFRALCGTTPTDFLKNASSYHGGLQ